MKRTALFLFSLLMAYMIGLNINHLAVTDSLSVEAMETITQLEDGEERNNSDDAFDFTKFKTGGAGDDDLDSSSGLPGWPLQLLLLPGAWVFEIPSLSIKPGAYPASFTRPPMFILHHNSKVFPA
jgi:hypothetical protein